MSNLDQAVKNRQQIADIKRRYSLGEISREEAQIEAQPIIDRINEAIRRRTSEFNQRHDLHQKPALLDFISLMR